MVPSLRVVNHSGIGLHPWMVGRALQGQVESHLETEFVGPGDKGIEIVERAELRVDGVMAALGRSDRVRRTRIVLVGDQRVVRALAVDRADRVDRRQVDDVETHRRDGRQPLGGGGEGARLPQPGGLVELAALGAREELVPGAVQRPLPFDQPRVVRARS